MVLALGLVGPDGVIPLWQNRMSFDLDSCLVGSTDFEFRRVIASVQNGTTAKTGSRAGAPNMFEHRFVADQWFSSPIGADEIEHAVFNQVPLGRARRKMPHSDGQAKLIRQLLQPHAPDPASRVVAATAPSSRRD